MSRRCSREPSTALILETDAFCWHCGAPTEEVNDQWACGHRNLLSHHYCTTCGAPEPAVPSGANGVGAEAAS